MAGEDVQLLWGATEGGAAVGSLTFKANKITGAVNRDVKYFDLGTFAFLMDELLAGYKLPNFITDYLRDKEGFTFNYTLIEGSDGDDLTALEETLWAHRKVFKLTAPKYKYNWLKIGSSITTDNCIVNNTGEGNLYVRVKDFDWVIDMEDQGGITCNLTLINGFIIRLID